LWSKCNVLAISRFNKTLDLILELAVKLNGVELFQFSDLISSFCSYRKPLQNMQRRPNYNAKNASLILT